MNGRTAVKWEYVGGAIILSVILFYIWQVYSFLQVPPFNPKLPRVDKLRNVFYADRKVFEQVRAMTSEDALAELQITQGSEGKGVKRSRLQAYKSLLTSLSTNVDLVTDGNHVVQFIFEQDEASLILDRHWSNGIVYVKENADRYGRVVKDESDMHLNQEAFYLLALDEHWFIFHKEY